MKRSAAILVLMVTVLFLAAGCNDNGTSSAPKGDPRDVIIKQAIKKAAGTTNAMEYFSLFADHPDVKRDMHIAEKLWIMASVIGSVNGHDLDLGKMKDIKLKAPAPSKSPNKWYCLDGSFTYSGPARLGSSGKTEIASGNGKILACTKENKDGKPYLDKIEFKLSPETIQKAWAKIDAQKKAAKASGRGK